MEEKYELTAFQTFLPNSRDKENVWNIAIDKDTMEVISKKNFQIDDVTIIALEIKPNKHESYVIFNW